MNETTEHHARNSIPSGIIRKSAARLAAVQSLYCKYINGIDKDSKTLMNDFIDMYGMKDKAATEGSKYQELCTDDIRIDIKYLKKMVRGVSGKEEELDALIAEFLTDDWELDRIGLVLRALLQAATYEITYSTIPTPTLINEYIEVSRAFFEEKEVKFTNGILDRIARKVRQGGG